MRDDAINFEKLPMKVQRYIQRLERDNEAHLAKLSAGPEGSDTFVKNYGVADDKPLGKAPTIAFQLDDDSHVEVRNHGNHVQVLVSARRGTQTMSVQTASSNLIRIGLGARLDER